MQACRTPSGHMLHFKVGLHSGPVMGGVAGLQRRFFRLFGDTMNTTARMAQSAPQGCIQVTPAIHSGGGSGKRCRPPACPRRCSRSIRWLVCFTGRRRRVVLQLQPWTP